MSKLSPEERERCDAALAEARVALSKVFDSFVVCVRYEDLNERSSIQSDWHGGFSDAVGLTHILLWRLQKQEMPNVEFDEPDTE
jgi:hypothetical protein